MVSLQCFHSYLFYFASYWERGGERDSLVCVVRAVGWGVIISGLIMRCSCLYLYLAIPYSPFGEHVYNHDNALYFGYGFDKPSLTRLIHVQNCDHNGRLTTAFGTNLKSSTPLEPKFPSNSSVPAHLAGFEGAGMGRFVELHEGVEGAEAVKRIKGLLGLERGES